MASNCLLSYPPEAHDGHRKEQSADKGDGEEAWPHILKFRSPIENGLGKGDEMRRRRRLHDGAQPGRLAVERCTPGDGTSGLTVLLRRARYENERQAAKQMMGHPRRFELNELPD